MPDEPVRDPITADPRVVAAVAAHPYGVLFATVSGAHLYGFASPDSDVDLRGVHVLPLAEVVGLDVGPETVERSEDRGGLEIDLVTHDLAKFARLLARPNGYVLEQALSPLVVRATPDHAELADIARRCVTRHHANHYRGFAKGQWGLLMKEQPRRIKPLLYVYRVLLTGIHLMQTGTVEANLQRLNEAFGLPFIDDLIALKTGTAERAALPDADLDFHAREYGRLQDMLDEAATRTHLPDKPPARRDLHDFVVRVRLATASSP